MLILLWHFFWDMVYPLDLKSQIFSSLENLPWIIPLNTPFVPLHWFSSWWTPIMRMLNCLIFHYCHLLCSAFYPFTFFVFAFPTLPSVFYLVFSSYLFSLVLHPILSSFYVIFNFIPLLSSALQLTFHILMSCHVSDLILKRKLYYFCALIL